jgi:hypothetical protein
MLDPILPPAARRPEEAVELVPAALSDGDLEAALAQYERGAALSGLGSSVVRRQPDGTWCIVAEAWCLGEPGISH